MRFVQLSPPKNRLLLLIFFFRKLVFLLILAAGLLWMKDSSLAFLGKTSSHPSRFFCFYAICSLLLGTSALETIFCGQFTLSTWIMKQNYLVYLWVRLSFLTVCALVYSNTFFFFLSVAASVLPFFLLVLLSANFPFFLYVCPKLVLSACLSLVSFSPVGNHLAV